MEIIPDGVSAFIVCNGDGNSLWVQRDGNAKNFPFYWNMPGGGIEPGEKPFDALLREIYEEVNLTQYSGVNRLGKYHYCGEASLYRYLICIDDEEREQLYIRSEGVDMEFLTLDQVLGRKITPYTRNYITENKDSLEKLMRSEINAEDFVRMTSGLYEPLYSSRT